MSIRVRLESDMKAALRGGDKARLGVLRLALAAIKQREIDSRTTLGEAEIEAVIKKMIKQGQDAARQFEAAGREELAAKESAEIAVLKQYMPEPLTEAELEALIDGALRKTGATSLSELGKVMAAIKAQASGRVDLAAVSARVRAVLSGD